MTETLHPDLFFLLFGLWLFYFNWKCINKVRVSLSVIASLETLGLWERVISQSGRHLGAWGKPLCTERAWVSGEGPPGGKLQAGSWTALSLLLPWGHPGRVIVNIQHTPGLVNGAERPYVAYLLWFRGRQCYCFTAYLVRNSEKPSTARFSVWFSTL